MTLDVGTDNEELLNDPMYIGLRQPRSHTSVENYDAFIREFMTSATKRFGSDTLLQFEDFATPNAIRLLDNYRDDFLCFNDDIQGTAAMTLAGVLAALGDDLHNHTFLFNGAGSAGIGIAHMLAFAIAESGSMSLETARKRIWAVDSRGLVVKNRPNGGLAAHKLAFAHEHDPVDSLLEAVRSLRPTVLIGVSSQPGSFSADVLELVASYCERPLIFALSNPTCKAECTAEEAYRLTGGRALYASGSPFDAVELDGQRFEPSQANNVYIFVRDFIAESCASTDCASARSRLRRAGRRGGEGNGLDDDGGRPRPGRLRRRLDAAARRLVSTVELDPEYVGASREGRR